MAVGRYGFKMIVWADFFMHQSPLCYGRCVYFCVQDCLLGQLKKSPYVEPTAAGCFHIENLNLKWPRFLDKYKKINNIDSTLSISSLGLE